MSIALSADRAIGLLPDRHVIYFLHPLKDGGFCRFQGRRSRNEIELCSAKLIELLDQPETFCGVRFAIKFYDGELTFLVETDPDKLAAFRAAQAKDDSNA